MGFRAERQRSSSERLRRIVVIGLAATALTACEQQAAAATSPSTALATVPAIPEAVVPAKPDITSELQNAWATALKDYSGEIDVAVYDYATGETARYTNAPNKLHVTASTVKLLILEKLETESQASGLPITDEEMDDAKLMISQSNNDATERLWESSGGAPSMQDFLNNDLHIPTTQASSAWGVTLTSAPDMVAAIRQVSDPGTLLSPSSVAQANELLDEVIPGQRWGVNGGVPVNAGVTVRLKNGWLDDTSAGNDFANTNDWTTNSVGYVEGDSNGKHVKYAMAEFSSGNPDFESGKKTLNDLAAVTWNIMAEQ